MYEAEGLSVNVPPCLALTLNIYAHYPRNPFPRIKEQGNQTNPSSLVSKGKGTASRHTSSLSLLSLRTKTRAAIRHGQPLFLGFPSLWLRSDHRLLITVSTSPQNEVILLHSDKVNQAAMLESQWRTWYWLCVCQGTCNLPSGAYNLTVKLSILHPVIGREKKITRIQERFPFVREIGKTML